uniref:GGACT domain-containing protein n=1 Tax=Macrostomum lignano TaxID=282301 RepID=A0A1I8F7Z9_9PLAT
KSGSLLPSQQQSSKSAIDTLAADDSARTFATRSCAIGIALGFSRQLFQGSFPGLRQAQLPGSHSNHRTQPGLRSFLGCLYQLSRRHAIEDIARADAHQGYQGVPQEQLGGVRELCTTGKTETCWVYIARKEEDNPYWLGRAEPSEIAFQV